MPGTNITMVGTIAGGNESGLAQIDVPVTGNITGVFWSLTGDLDGDLDFMLAMLSFGSAYALANDSRQLISMLRLFQSQVSAASAVFNALSSMHVMSLPVSMGERIFMHASTTAATAGTAIAVISFDFDLDRPLARRR